MTPPDFPRNSAFWQVVKLEKRLTALTDTTLSDTELLGMGIHRAPQLDVDNTSASDAWPVFFQPLEDSIELREAAMDLERELGCWSHCPYEAEHVDRLACALQTHWWFEHMRCTADAVHKSYPTDVPRWRGIR